MTGGLPARTRLAHNDGRLTGGVTGAMAGGIVIANPRQFAVGEAIQTRDVPPGLLRPLEKRPALTRLARNDR
ncbi:MAG: hypothetical protein LBT00_11900 [Spirochaetaceae bacterium]|jgi:hypothetical protein|nr:hypothetical protein [Spirochaetaceae bacterium]